MGTGQAATTFDVVARVVFAVAVIVPSSGCAAGCDAGLSPGLRTEPIPIDSTPKLFVDEF
ncbi:hypothetical protein PSH03_001878 [Micromonospora sp. PSH03]|uniref:hypothetical protein n=1 Tax=Micromonospora TaxID=1873 RepID=UPI001EE969D6|nr:hypothetical protein [Micromonospora salmantinae]MCG5456973.1 hypothetical protein [Micromonospora salmantinae]